MTRQTTADRIFGSEVFARQRLGPTTLQTKAPLQQWTQADFRRERVGIVYVLVDPRDRQIRYVGYTGGSLAARLRQHLQHARKQRGKANYYAINWLNTLIDEGLRPEIIAVDTFVAHNWQQRERHWIDVFRQLGCDLTNTKPGGGGGEKRGPSPLKGRKFSDEHRRRISEAARRRFADPEERRRASEVRKGKGTGPYAPGRWRPEPKTHCPQNHEYTEENTLYSEGKRRCRACSQERDRARPRRPSAADKLRRAVNGNGTPQTDADMANAARVATEGK